METDRKWIVVRIDGKIAAVPTDYRLLTAISDAIKGQKVPARHPTTSVFKSITDRPSTCPASNVEQICTMNLKC